MANSKPSLPKGTRDFSPAEMGRRNLILSAITNVFHKYGFEQIETPAMENLSTLTGKYGEEGDQLLFKILKSRIHESKEKEQLKQVFHQALERNTNSELLTERALRYDLTIPFARYVAMHQHEITFPFRRYQIQPVWRADRPQKGRYREFVQCDADMIGSNSLLNESDLVLITRDVFKLLGLNITMLINNRKILAGIAEVTGMSDRFTEMTVAIDKIDKAGIEGVISELQSKNIPASAITKLESVLKMQGSNEEKLAFLGELLASSTVGREGIDEVTKVMQLAAYENLVLDISLARGLNYYTGAIFEVKSRDIQFGSIAGGGRYDDLTGMFGLSGISGVGISFGIDRIYDVMSELDLFSKQRVTHIKSDVLFINFSDAELPYSYTLVQALRSAGIAAEMYPDAVKMKKQMGYADANSIPFVCLAGTNEINDETVTIKNMSTGEQQTIAKGTLINFFLNHSGK